ncbi:hypothetical protein [Bradyrhizobium zhanjiangense]|uniref:hypothetical protein n=1 Tax=Bradyrhizobium zhanjiangense TaxID=1325107 RepID=UPI001ABFF979|nr:hypothetical protein [Bradyrhizobium zhanjiangense]
MVWTNTSDVSIVDQNGKVIFSALDVSLTTSASGTAVSCEQSRGKAAQGRARFPGMATPAWKPYQLSE